LTKVVFPLSRTLLSVGRSARPPLMQPPPPPRHMPPNTKVGLLIKTEGSERWFVRSASRTQVSAAAAAERAAEANEGAEILINALTYVSLCNINNDLATHLPRPLAAA
jgi:hypothetical protein